MGRYCRQETGVCERDKGWEPLVNESKLKHENDDAHCAIQYILVDDIARTANKTVIIHRFKALTRALNLFYGHEANEFGL